MKNTKVILAATVLLVVFAGGGFYAGIKYQQSQRGQPNGLSGNLFRRFGGLDGSMGGAMNQRGVRMGFRPVVGEIINQDDKSITVELEDGGSKIVLVSESTSVNKASQGSKDDLKVGESVAVFGQENSDGSVTAQNIQLNPQARGSFDQHSEGQ